MDEKKSNSKKGCLIAVIIIIIISICVGFSVTNEQENTQNDENKEEEKLSKNAELIKQMCNTTDMQSLVVEEALKGCEITQIDKITHDEMLDNSYNQGDTGYRIKSGNINNIILYLDSQKNVISIRYAGVDLYSEDTHKEKLSAFYLTSDEEVDLRTACEKYVKSVLRSPTTADFPWLDWRYSKEYSTQIATVSSYVDAQNAFGTKVRSYFTFMYQMKENGFSLLYFEIDNEVIVDNR